MPARSRVRPSRLVPTATMCPPDIFRRASRAVCFTSLASVLSIGSRPDSSKTGVMLPSAAVENEISGARLVPAIVQLSLPRVTTTSAAIRSAAAFAASAVAVGTAGANGTTGTSAVIDAGVSIAASCWSSVVSRAALSTARPSFAGETLNVPPWPADTEASTGVWSIVVARLSMAAAELVAVVDNGGVEGHAVDRGLGCADEVREGLALATCRECRVEHRRGVEVAADVRIADRRRLAVRAGERDLPGADRPVGVRDLPPRACSRVSPPRSVLPTRTPGRIRPCTAGPMRTGRRRRCRP